MKCKLKDFQQTKEIASIETNDNLFFLYADEGSFHKTNLKKLVRGNTVSIEGIDLNSEDYIVGPGTITNIYTGDHKLLYAAKKSRLSLKNYL